MNIIETKNFLEYANKDDLVNMMQEPNPHFPAFLVLSEIQRRNIHDQNFQAMLDRPTTTVAEEVVSNFAQPQLAQNQLQGLQDGVPEATPLPTNISAGLSGAPTAPMQMAASGGITGYQNTGSTSLPAGSEPRGLFSNTQSMSRLDQILGDKPNTALNASFQNPNAKQFSSTSNQDIPKEVLEEVETIGLSRGADFLKFAGVLNEDGSIDPLGATLAVASLHPIGRAAGWLAKVGIGIGKKYLPGIATGLKGLVTKPNPVLKGGLKAGQRKVLQPDGTYKLIDNLTGKLINPTVFSAAKTAQTLGTTALPAAIVKNMSDSAKEQYAIDEEEKRLAALEAEAERKKRLEEEKTKQGLTGAAETAKKDNTGNWRDLARLGAGIMSAKNVGDIGTAVTGVLDAQDKREIQGLQSKYMQVQTEKLEADIAAMPLKELIAAQNSLTASIKEKIAAGIILTPQEELEVSTLFKFYAAEIARRQGFVASTKLTKKEQEAMDKAIG